MNTMTAKAGDTVAEGRRGIIKAAGLGIAGLATGGAVGAPPAKAALNAEPIPDSAGYTVATTGLLIVDPYNDFMSEKGKLFEATRASREKVGTFDNMRKVIKRARAAGIQVFIVPHHRSHHGDYKGWEHMNPSQIEAHAAQVFAVGSWGGEFNPEFGPKEGDVVVNEHWAQSGFATTDLDAQLKQHGIRKLVFIGMLANTCIESTARYGMELGYHVTLVRDATAAFSLEGMHTAHDVNGPAYAHAILTTEQIVPMLPAALANPNV